VSAGCSADKQSAAAFSGHLLGALLPNICANPSSHVISQPSISSTACQVLVLLHRPTISILGPDGPSYPPPAPMFADLKTMVPTVMYIVAPCVPSNAAQICSQPPNILSTQCGHDLQPDSRQPGVSMPAVYSRQPGPYDLHHRNGHNPK